MPNKLFFSAAMALITATAAAQASPAKPPFFGKSTVALLKVEKADAVATRASGTTGIVIRTYRAVLLVEDSLPGFAKDRVFLTIERAEVEAGAAERSSRGVPSDEFVHRMYAAAKMPYQSWFPVEKGSEFIAAFDGVTPVAKDMKPTIGWEGCPLGEAWRDHKAFYEALKNQNEGKRVRVHSGTEN